MWLDKRRTLFIAVGARRLECGLASGRRWIRESLLDIPINLMAGAAVPAQAIVVALEGLESALSQLKTASDNEDQRIGEIRVVLADTWLASVCVPWSEAVQQPFAAELSARSQFAAAGFSVDDRDVVRLDEAGFGQPRLAVSYPADVVAAFTRLAANLEARLVSLAPLSVIAWNLVGRGHRERLGALAVLDKGLLLVLSGHGRLTNVACRRTTDASGPHELAEQWRRMQLRELQLAGRQELPVLDLTAPDSVPDGGGSKLIRVELPTEESSASLPLRLAAMFASVPSVLDALPAKFSMSAVRWGIALLALLLGAFFILQAWKTHERGQVLAAELGAERSVAQPVFRQHVWTRDQIARIQSVNLAIRELNLPVSSLLRALQPPPDLQLTVLSVDLTSTRGAVGSDTSTIKIVGEARSAAEMTWYVGFVAEHKPFTMAYLTQHEIVESTPERPYRFTVEAAWKQ